jgi:hypothetical protein
MAAGDYFIFDQFYVDVQEGVHNLETDSIKLGFVTGVTPVSTDADPRWGAGGTTNFSSSEVTPGGNYSSGGPAVANPTVTLSSNRGIFDGDDISIAQDGSNPTNARWGILYNDTAAGKNCIGAVDFGASIDLTSGPFELNWNNSGIHLMGEPGSW